MAMAKALIIIKNDKEKKGGNWNLQLIPTLHYLTYW